MQENMRENSIIKARILEYLENKGISRYQFYHDTGVSNGVLSQKNGLSEDNILKFLSCYSDISPEWLLTGEGEMLKTKCTGYTPAHSDPQTVDSDTEVTDNNPYTQALTRKKRTLIPFYDDVASIGGVNTISAVVDGSMPPSEYIDAGDWFHEASAAIRHYGDSMTEYPSGCILAIKKVEDMRLILWGRDYVIETDEFRITKRLQRGTDSSTIVACSSNTDTYPDGRLIHEPVVIPLESIRGLWLVLGHVVKQFSSGAVYIRT